MSHSRKVSVTGLGYVGLPVAVAFAHHGEVIGYDYDPQRIAQLRAGEDRTGEIELAELRQESIATLRGLRPTAGVTPPP